MSSSPPHPLRSHFGLPGVLFAALLPAAGHAFPLNPLEQRDDGRHEAPDLAGVATLDGEDAFRNPFLDPLPEEDEPQIVEAPEASVDSTPKAAAASGNRELHTPETAGNDDLQTLRVYLHDLRTPSVGFTTATIKYVIHVSNPNPRPIRGPLMVYEAFIADVGVAVGRTYLPDIPAGGHRRYESGFIVSYIDLGRSLVTAIRNRDVSLRVEGTLSAEGRELRFVTELRADHEETP